MHSVLVIAPHADDAEFGMGGYLSRMVRERTAKPTVGVVAGGDYVDRFGELVAGQRRKAETAAAMALLGVTDHITLAAVEENKFDLAGRAVLIDAVEDLLSRDAFHEVFVCRPSLNQDHTALYEATLAAFRPGRFEGTGLLWAYEHPGAAAVSDYTANGRCYVRLQSADMQAKIASLEAHASQFAGKAKGHDSPRGAARLAALRGSEAGCDYAELLWLVREIY